MRFLLDINHNPVVLTVISYHLECLGWKIGKNALTSNPYWSKFPTGIPRYFEIDIESKNLSWTGGEEENDPIKMYDTIDSFEEATAFMQFLRDNFEKMKNVPEPLPPLPPVPNPYTEYYANDPSPVHYYQKHLKQSDMVDKLLMLKKELIEEYHHSMKYGSVGYEHDALYHKIKQVEYKLDSLDYYKTKTPSYYDEPYSDSYGMNNDGYYVTPKWKCQTNGLDY